MSGLILPFDWSRDMHVLDDDLLTSYLNSQIEEPTRTEPEPCVKETLPRKPNRLERNREAARVSRLRKKDQLRGLEEKLAGLTEELNTLRNETPVNFSSDRELLALFTTKDGQNHEDLRTAKGEGKRHKLREVIEEAQQQFGITGAERQGIIHFFFQQIKGNVAPEYVKDLLQVCTNASQLSANWSALEASLGLSSHQSTELRRQKKVLTSLGVKHEHYHRRFKRIQKSLARRACAFQGLFDTVTDGWTQPQLAEFLAHDPEIPEPAELWRKKKSRRSSAMQKRLKAEADLMAID